MSWHGMCFVVEPFPSLASPTSPIGLKRTPRLHFRQDRFNRSDPTAKETLNDPL